MNAPLPIDVIEADQPLTLQTRAALALNSTKTERALTELALKNAHIVAVIDKAGRQQAHGAAMELKAARVAIEKTSKAAREDAVQFGKAILSEERRLTALVEPEENDVYRYGDNPSSVPAGYPYTATSPEQTTVEAFQDGNAEAFEEAWYFSSTQYSESYAWDQYFGSGDQDGDLKDYVRRVRFVRLIPLNPSIL